MRNYITSVNNLCPENTCITESKHAMNTEIILISLTPVLMPIGIVHIHIKMDNVKSSNVACLEENNQFSF